VSQSICIYRAGEGKNGAQGALDLTSPSRQAARRAGCPLHFIFSCPPYGNLESYSDDQHDLSNMEWPAFLDAYRRIISLACEKLRDNRFACFVVGDFRDEHGAYRNFVSKAIRAFQNCGCILYNEAILVTALGSVPMRVSRQFISGRKLCKTHQNVLVFCKGDWKKAALELKEKGS